MLGLRFDVTGGNFFGTGGDLNIEAQFIPQHLLPRYWGKESVFGAAIGTGGERAIKIRAVGNVTSGFIVGLVGPPESLHPVITSIVGGDLTLGGGIEADITFVPASQDVVVYVGTGVAVESPGVYVGAGQSTYIDPAVFWAKVFDFLGLF
jgi:hypothetical protein